VDVELVSLRLVHYTDPVGEYTRHTIGFRGFGRYLVVTWTWC
jgi:hypothetical protein